MDKTWTNNGQKLDKTCTFVKKLSKFCPTPHSTGAPKEVANFANDKTDRLRETANKGGRGSKIPKILRT